MSAENAWRIAKEAVSDAVSDMEFWRGKAAEEFSTTVSSRIRSLPMPPAFRAEVEAEAEELLGMLRVVIAACDEGRMVPRSGAGGMTIEANIRGSVYNGVPAWPIEEARALLSRLEAKGESHE